MWLAPVFLQILQVFYHIFQFSFTFKEFFLNFTDQTRFIRNASMDDLLYILIGIAWVAFTYYNNKQKQAKKRAAREAQGEPPLAAPPPIRSVFEELLNGGMSPVPAPVVINPEEKKNNPEPWDEVSVQGTAAPEAESLEVIEDEVPARYFDDEYEGRTNGMPEEMHLKPEADSDTEVPVFDVAAEFDLRSAVIYAEVLNPRYF